MSAAPTDTTTMSIGGIFKNAVNKVKLKASEAATDPKANAAAEKANPEFISIEELPTDTQILLGQIRKVSDNYMKTIAENQMTKSIIKNTKGDVMFGYVLGMNGQLNKLGINDSEKKVRKDIEVNRTLFNNIIDIYKKFWLSIYAQTLPEIPLPDFKNLLNKSVPPYPGETGPGGIEMPGISRDAVQSFKKSFMDTITGTGLTILIVLLCTFMGTLAANDSIGRSGFIRVINFIYASIPFFAPFVAIYYIYRYIKGTPPKIYAYLPLVQIVADQGKIAGLLLAPFSYIPDFVPGTTKQVMTEVYDTVASGFVFKGEPKSEPTQVK